MDAWGFFSRGHSLFNDAAREEILFCGHFVGEIVPPPSLVMGLPRMEYRSLIIIRCFVEID